MTLDFLLKFKIQLKYLRILLPQVIEHTPHFLIASTLSIKN